MRAAARPASSTLRLAIAMAIVGTTACNAILGIAPDDQLRVADGGSADASGADSRADSTGDSSADVANDAGSDVAMDDSASAAETASDVTTGDSGNPADTTATVDSGGDTQVPPPADAGGTVHRVQTSGWVTVSAATQADLADAALPAAATAGDLLVVIAFYPEGANVSLIVQTQDTWMPLLASMCTAASTTDVELWYVVASAATAMAGVEVKIDSPGQFEVIEAEYRGVAALDTYVRECSNISSMVQTSNLTTTGSDLVIAAFGDFSSSQAYTPVLDMGFGSPLTSSDMEALLMDTSGGVVPPGTNLSAGAIVSSMYNGATLIAAFQP